MKRHDLVTGYVVRYDMMRYTKLTWTEKLSVVNLSYSTRNQK